MKVTFTPVKDQMDELLSVDTQALKQAVAQHFRETKLIGTPDANVRIDFSPQDGSDILVAKTDPEEALGVRSYASEDDFNQQQRLDAFCAADALMDPEGFYV